MKIDHIQLAMPHGREDDARRFWQDLMGMQEVVKPPALQAKGGCWFELGGTAVHVGVEADFRPQKKAHPAFAVNDLNELAQKLTQADYLVQWDDSIPGLVRFFTTDPFGNRLEFLTLRD